MPSDLANPASDDDIVPLNRMQAESLRKRLLVISPVRVVLVQMLISGVLSLSIGLGFDQPHWAWSFAYGSAAIFLPACLMAVGMRSKVGQLPPAASMARFFLWEMVKIFVSAIMLAASPFVISNINWPSMIAGLIVTTKVYLFAGILQRANSTKIERI